MCKKTIYLSIIFFAAILTSVKAADLPYKEGELLIRFAPKADGIQRTTDERNQILSSFNAGTIKHTVRLVPGLSLVKLPEGVTVEVALSKLKASGDILYVEPNYRIRLASTFPNDTRFDELWGMHNTGQTGGTVDADIDAPEAWDVITDSSTIVAVLDTGIDYTHPDLSANIWVNEAELNGAPNFDDDDNGYIDDIRGWDFADNDNDPTDYLGHGTHCAGTIGASGNNDLGVVGVCWNVQIMNLKIFPNYGEETFISGAIDAIEYAVYNGATVLSNSWRGYNYSQSLKDAINISDANSVLFVAAAGNEGYNNDSYPAYPASYDCNNIISVMATNHTDQVTYYSNYGPTSVDIGAPGGETYYSEDEGILSTIPGNGYAFYQGTSMAAPHVAGACALVWAANPQLTHLEVKDYILQGVDKLDSLDGLCVSEGRLNLWRAVKGKAAFPYLTFTKDVDDANCVSPFNDLLENYLTYNICWDANGSADTNVVVVDYLPDEVEYYTSDPCGTYNQNERTVTWNIGNISADDSNCITLIVKVTTDAEPGGTITNTCEIEGDNYIATDSKATCVACWAGEILYVDADANDGGDGLSWQMAYNDLQDALDATQTCDCYTDIWVAAGTYKPIWDANDMTMNETFELIEGIGLFGHFGGIGTYETSTMQRNFADANNETIIDGKIGEGYSEKVYYPITAVDVEDAIVDGFTIRGGFTGGIKMDSADVGVVNCKIKNNNSYGVYANNYSHPDIHNCTFIDNSSYGLYANSSCWPEVSNCVFDGNDTSSGGIYMTNYTVIVADDCVFKNHTNYGISGSSGTLTVDNSTFDENPYGLSLSDVTTTMTNCSVNNSDYYGVYCSNSDLTVNHSVIANSEYEGLYMDSGCNLILQNSVVRYNGYEGLELHNNLTTTLTNNWIHNNGTDEYAYYYGGAGIYFYNHTWPPLVRNNTIYDNCTYGIQMSENGGEPNIVNCIVYANDSNDLYRENDDFENVNYCNLQNSHAGTGNITGDPGFKNVATDPNDLHLDETSQCKDTGDPNGDYDETDIDGENRIYYGRVDMGADEYYWSDADFDEDGIVNFIDYAILAAAWQSESGEGNYNETCDLEDNNAIDFNDLALFCEDWLWEKAWDEGWMMCMGGGGGDFGLESMSLMESSLSLDSSETATSAKRSDALMLSVAESLRTRPERLAAKSQKFYDITPETTISAKRKALKPQPQSEPEPQPQLTEQDIEELIDWLEELWLTDEELRQQCTEAEWQEFVEAVGQTPIY